MSELIETLPAPEAITVHEPHGFVRLIGYFGDELSVVNAARVSLHKESTPETDGLFLNQHSQTTPSVPISDSDKGLINFLLKKKHGSPFEHGFMAQFHIRVPIFVMREWVRHRIGFSINEESGRYGDRRPDFYIHDDDHIRTQHGKPGAYTFEVSDDPGINEWWKGMLKMQSERAYDTYKMALDNGIAKEVARVCLPLNLYTEFRWTCNARSLMNFLALRNDSPAMQEIRDYAKVIEDIFAQHMPTVHQAFIDNGRVAP